MLPAFLITLREVLEATLIVATIAGILIKLGRTKSVKTVWLASGAAFFCSLTLIALGSLLGFQVKQIYSGKTEELIEGVLMITSAVFITYAVFFLHKYFAQYKIHLIKKIKDSMEQNEQKGLFVLAFTAVFREGIEIALFLSTIYFSSSPLSILTGFSGGLVVGLIISLLVLTTTVRLPVFYAFRATSILLILFAAGLLARGIHEFAEVGLISEIGKLSFTFIPHADTLSGAFLKSVFGISRTMDAIQLSLYAGYTGFMVWWVFFRQRRLTFKP